MATTTMARRSFIKTGARCQVSGVSGQQYQPFVKNHTIRGLNAVKSELAGRKMLLLSQLQVRSCGKDCVVRRGGGDYFERLCRG